MLLRESSNGGGVAPFFSSARAGMLFCVYFWTEERTRLANIYLLKPQKKTNFSAGKQGRTFA